MRTRGKFIAGFWRSLTLREFAGGMKDRCGKVKVCLTGLLNQEFICRELNPCVKS